MSPDGENFVFTDLDLSNKGVEQLNKTIEEAKEVEGADKLLKLIVNLDKEKRTIFAGIKSAYKVEDLVGRSVVVVANLAPRKMKFGTSEGMILAAGPGGDQIFLLSTDEGAKPGMKIK